MEEEITLGELFGVIKKRLGMIVSLGMIGLILSSLFTFFIATPQYSSTTQILVSRTEAEGSIEQGDINVNLQLINTYKDLIKGPVILDDVRETLNLDMAHTTLSDKIQIGTQQNSQVFSISVTDANPFNAASIANTTAQTFQNKIGNIMNVDNVTIVSEAMANTNPVSPNAPLNLAVGLLLGVMIALGIAFLLEFMDNTIKDDKYITEELEWPYLGRVSEMDKDEMKPYRGLYSEDVSHKRVTTDMKMRKSRT